MRHGRLLHGHAECVSSIEKVPFISLYYIVYINKLTVYTWILNYQVAYRIKLLFIQTHTIQTMTQESTCESCWDCSNL